MKCIAATDPAAPAMFWQAIRAGKLVAYPTDTLYGLGTDAANRPAVERLAEVKGSRGPFSVMVGQLKDLREYALVSPEITAKLINMLPGPFTIILPPHLPETLSSPVIGSGGKVGFRVPGHPFIKAAFQHAKGLVITTSVNRAGQAPLQDPEAIKGQFEGQIDLLVDAGLLSPSKGSTVLDATVQPWEVLRQGDGKF